MRLTIPDSAKAGPVPITIKTKSGVVTTEKFSVKLRSPVVAKVKPDSLLRGGEYDVVLSGTHLVLPGDETRVSIEEPLTAKVVGRPSDREFKVHVVVPPDAPTGPRSLLLETTDGKVSSMLVVALAPPLVSKPKIVAVERGGSLEVVLEGRSLGATQPVVLAVPDPEILIEATAPPTAATIPLRIRAGEKALPGARLLVVRSSDGFITLPLEVTAVVPDLGVPDPQGMTRGASVDVTLPFAPLPPKSPYGLSVVPADSGVVAKAKGRGVFTLDVAADAPPGPRTLVAIHPWGIGVRPFTIGTRPPAVNGITPSEVAPGGAADLVIEGKYLEGAAISLASADPALTLTPGVNATTARLEVRADARPGPRALAVRTKDGVALAFVSIKGGGISAPSVSSALPTRMPRGTATKVVLSGTNLKGAAGPPTVVARDAAGGEIAARVGAASATSVEVTLEPGAGTPIGGCLLTISTADGTTAATLMVLPSAPTLSAVEPATLLRGGVREVTLTGTNLVSPDGKPSAISVGIPGEPGLSPTIVSAAAEKVVLRLDTRAIARVGAHLLTLSHSEGGAAIVLRVEGAPPAIDTLAPTIVGTPAMVDLVVTGRQLVGSDGKPAIALVTRIGAAASLAPQVVKADPTSVVVRVTTTAAVGPGPHVLILRTIDGEAVALFSVVAVPPAVIQRLAPNKAPRNGGALAAITGTGLSGATAVEFAGNGVKAVILAGGKDTELLVRISVAADAAPGDRSFTVTTPGGPASSGTTVLTVE